MAESAVLSLASKILSTIASPAFDKAYERGLSIWEAKDELAKLRVTIETIQAVLLDAERKQESSAAVRNWIRRLKCVLYDADDLFDEVATDDLLKQQMIEGNNKLSLKNKWLRALWLVQLGIENVPNSIGELKHLRYLDLSWNKFESLPESMTNLLNLLTLDIQGCRQLKVLSGDFRKLINLRCLTIKDCYSLKHMPSGIGEMSCLQYLSNFKVGRRSIKENNIKASGLDQLARLEQLRGELSIEFEDGISDWDGYESWQLPQLQLQELEIKNYPGKRIPRCGFNGRANNLAYLELRECRNVKYLLPLRCLPNLKRLYLKQLEELEYVEDGDSCTTEVVRSSSNFPRLESLWLIGLPKLKGWWSEVATSSSMFLSFPLLSHLYIRNCPQLKSIPLCPLLETLILDEMDGNMVIEQVLSNNSSTSSTSPAFKQL